MNVAELLTRQAATHPDAPAITETNRGRDRTVSFADLDCRSFCVAANLLETGLAPGDRVLVLYSMGIDLYVALLAVIRAGMTATFIDPGAGGAHVDYACAIARPRAMLAPWRANWLRLRYRGLRRIPLRLSVRSGQRIADRLQKSGATCWQGEVTPRSPADPAMLTFTSGSTGRPKAVVRTHGFLLAQLEAIRESIPMHAGETELATMPIFVLASLAAGVHSVIAAGDLGRPVTIAPDPVLAQIARHRPTRCIASPALLGRLAERCLAREAPMESLTHVFTGGAPVFLRTMQRLRRAAPSAQITAVYGSTEAEPIATVSLQNISREDAAAMNSGRGVLAGVPAPSVQLCIIDNQWGTPIGPLTDEAFQSQCLGPREPGEIVVTGDHVLGGYLDGAGDEETKFQVGGQTWHRTGDAGYLDQQGRLWLVGRAGMRIRDQRGELYPLSVEAAADQIPYLSRSALVGHAGKRVLVVEPLRGAPRDLERHVRRRLAFAEIDRVLVMDKIPVDRRHNAKIDYPALLARL
jgi:acyl-CoA synthetase (AMP-forming)/AMP-acid ligase II